MFDKFGEFDSVEELNLTAKGLLDEGDTDSLKALAAENGIEREDTEDYISGDTSELATLSMAVFGRLEILEKEEVETKKNQAEKMPLQVIMTILKGMCTENSMAEAVMKKGKRISKIYDAMRDEAKKHMKGNVGVSCGTDRQLCEIIRSYYLDSDKDFKTKISDLYK